MASKLTPAVAYLRTSSAANVGDGDSETRQRSAIEAFAKRAGFHVVDWFYDAAVSGTDEIMRRPAFVSMIDRIAGNGVRTVLIEDASRLARELYVQESAIIAMLRLGVSVIAANGDNLTQTDDPYRIAMRQMSGVFAELEKRRLVAKLRSGRNKVIAKEGHCGGPVPHRIANPAAHALAQRLSKKMSLREISAALAAKGHLNANGKPFNPNSIASMLRQGKHVLGA
jgi:DNA invertase Pin-like site-specific DNA recombinase